MAVSRDSNSSRPHVLRSQAPINRREISGVPFESVRLAGELINFRDIRLLYGKKFTGELLDGFTLKWADGPSTSNAKRAGALRRWLTDLDRRAKKTNAGVAVRSVRDKLRACDFRSIEKIEFEHALSDFLSRANDLTDFTIFRTGTAATRRPVIEALSAVLSQLAPALGWPDLGTLKPSLPRVPRGLTPSLGELLMPSGKSDLHSNSNQGQFAATVARNNERLDRLRKICEEELLRLYAIFQRGQRLIQREDLPSAEALKQAEADLDRVTVLENRRSKLPGVAQACFPSDDLEFQLAALLKHLTINRNRIISGNNDWATEGIRHLIVRHGGIHRIIELMEASDRAFVCAYAIVMIEGGLNVQCCDDLAANPFSGTIIAGKAELNILSTTKKRPKPKAVKALLGEGMVYLKAKGYEISGKRAIDIWLEMSAPIRRRAEQESEYRLIEISSGDSEAENAPRSDRMGGARVQDWLWILPEGSSNDGEIRKASSGNFRDWWKDLLADHADDPVIGGLEIRRKHIRPTYVQLKATGRNGDIALAALSANHNSTQTTFQNYLNRPYIKAELNDKIRQFQDMLQAAVIRNPASTAGKLSYSIAEFTELRERAKDSGLAFYQEVEIALIGDDKAVEFDGEISTIAYSDSDEAMRSAALLRLSLDQAEEEFFCKNPKRWFVIWFPLHALSIAVWNILDTGPRRRRFQEIANNISRGLAGGEILPFQPS